MDNFIDKSLPTKGQIVIDYDFEGHKMPKLSNYHLNQITALNLSRGYTAAILLDSLRQVIQASPDLNKSDVITSWQNQLKQKGESNHA